MKHQVHTIRTLIAVAAILVLTLSYEAQSQIWKTDSTLPSPDEYVYVSLEPEMISCEDPEYPTRSKEAGHWGFVIVKALIDATGAVRDATIDRSSGYLLLDKAAMEAAYACKWKPAVDYQYPVAAWVIYPVEFELEERETDVQQEETRSFAIMLVKEKDPASRDALPKGGMRIWGGFNDGLDSGMTGTISRDDNVYGEVDIANVSIEWVDGEEAICNYTMARADFFIKPWDRASFMPTKPKSSEILERGLAAFSEGKPEEALSYLDNIWCLARDNQFVAQATEQCRQQLDARKAADLSRPEFISWRRQTLDFLRMAKKFNTAGNPHMARRYVNRVLLIDSSNAMARSILDSIPPFDYYEDKTRQCNRFDSILAGTVIPEFGEHVPVDSKAKLVHCDESDFPDTHGYLSGLVRMRLLIGVTGEVLEVVLHRSSGFEVLDDESLKFARGCVYEPAIARGQPITTWTTYSISFVLY